VKRLNILILILMAVWVFGSVALTAHADIYSWTDENGVSHFTNYAPPKHAKLLMKTPEIPYDEEADNQRREADRLDVARQELAEREAFLLLEQQAAERRIAEAKEKAEAALWEADRILQEAETAAEDEKYGRSNGYVYGYGYYPYYRYDYRPWYYRKHVQHYKKHLYRYGHKPYSKHDYRKRPKHYAGGPYTPFRSRGLSHQERTALFRGKHGRF
jgi:hypothetical protein